MPAHPDRRAMAESRPTSAWTRSSSAAPCWRVPELGHSVHVEVDGLEPSRWYWYQFKVGNEVSPIGRTRTAPAAGSLEAICVSRSCRASTTRNGLYYAHKHLAEEDLDFAVHLGDYIYEGARDRPGRPAAPARRTRSRRSTTTGSATRSTSPIRICRRCTPRSRGS